MLPGCSCSHVALADAAHAAPSSRAADPTFLPSPRENLSTNPLTSRSPNDKNMSTANNLKIRSVPPTMAESEQEGPHRTTQTALASISDFTTLEAQHKSVSAHSTADPDTNAPLTPASVVTNSPARHANPVTAHPPLPVTSDPTAVATHTTRSHFLDLPAELRNEVYRFALPQGNHIEDADEDDNPEFDITESFPSLTHVCRQIRSEVMSLYLDTYIFIARVRDSDYSLLASWLEIFAGFDDNHKKAFSYLEVVCTGGLITCEVTSLCHKHQGRDQVQWSPNFPLWNALLVTMKEAGLMADTVRFEYDICIDALAAYYDELGEPGTIDSRVFPGVEEQYLFYCFVLPPLLRIHGLYDTHDIFPPEDVVRELVELHERAGRLHELDALVLQAAFASERPPELWFELWARHTSTLSASQQAVRAECARLREERLQGKTDASDGWHVGIPPFGSLVLIDPEVPCPECAAERS